MEAYTVIGMGTHLLVTFLNSRRSNNASSHRRIHQNGHYCDVSIDECANEACLNIVGMHYFGPVMTFFTSFTLTH
jgi:hypothetical protein